MTAKLFLVVLVVFCAVQGFTADTRSLSDLFSGFQNISAEIKDKVGHFQEQVKEKAEEVINKAKTQIADIKEDVKEKAAEIQGKVKQFEESAKEKVQEISSQFSQNTSKKSKRDDYMLSHYRNEFYNAFLGYDSQVDAIKEGYSNAVLTFMGKMNASTNALEDELNKIANETAAEFKDVTSDVSECYNAQRANASKIVEQVKSQIKDLIAYENQTYIQSLMEQADVTSKKVASLFAEGRQCRTYYCFVDVTQRADSENLYCDMRSELSQLQAKNVTATEDAISKLPGIIQPAIAEGKKIAEATAQCIREKVSA